MKHFSYKQHICRTFPQRKCVTLQILIPCRNQQHLIRALLMHMWTATEHFAAFYSIFYMLQNSAGSCAWTLSSVNIRTPHREDYKCLKIWSDVIDSSCEMYHSPHMWFTGHSKSYLETGLFPSSLYLRCNLHLFQREARKIQVSCITSAVLLVGLSSINSLTTP